MHILNTYTTYIRDPYICFDKPLSSSGGSSEGVKELRIYFHVENITHRNSKHKIYGFEFVCFEFLMCDICSR